MLFLYFCLCNLFSLFVQEKKTKITKNKWKYYKLMSTFYKATIRLCTIGKNMMVLFYFIFSYHFCFVLLHFTLSHFVSLDFIEFFLIFSLSILFDYVQFSEYFLDWFNFILFNFIQFYFVNFTSSKQLKIPENAINCYLHCNPANGLRHIETQMIGQNHCNCVEKSPYIIT